MIPLASRRIDASAPGSPAQVRELTTDEVNAVAGGAVVIAAIAIAVVAAAAYAEISDALSSESDDSGSEAED